MPQADEELREDWKHSEVEGGYKVAIRFLENAGYRLNEDWTWKLPNPKHSPTKREISAIAYLVFEWDFGGVRNEEVKDANAP